LSEQHEPLTSREMQEQLHSRVQEMLSRRVVTAAASHRSQQRHEALLARLDMDDSLLLGIVSCDSCHLPSDCSLPMSSVSFNQLIVCAAR